MAHTNETHDPKLTSWVISANDGQSDFPIQNLPFAVFRRRGSGEAWRGGVAIGDQIVDMAAAVNAGVFGGDAQPAAEAAGFTQWPIKSGQHAAFKDRHDCRDIADAGLQMAVGQ